MCFKLFLHVSFQKFPGCVGALTLNFWSTTSETQAEMGHCRSKLYFKRNIDDVTAYTARINTLPHVHHVRIQPAHRDVDASPLLRKVPASFILQDVCLGPRLFHSSW